MDDADKYVDIASSCETSMQHALKFRVTIGFRFSEEDLVNLVVSGVGEMIAHGDFLCRLHAWKPQTPNWWDAASAVIRGDGSFLFLDDAGRELVLDKASIERGLKLLAENKPETFMGVVQGDYDMWPPLRFAEFALMGESVIA